MRRRTIIPGAFVLAGLTFLGGGSALLNHSIREPTHLRDQNPNAVRLEELKNDVNYLTYSDEFFERLEKEPVFQDSYKTKLIEYRKLNTPENEQVLRDTDFAGMLGIPALYSLILGIGFAGQGVSDLRNLYRSRVQNPS